MIRLAPVAIVALLLGCGGSTGDASGAGGAGGHDASGGHGVGGSDGGGSPSAGGGGSGGGGCGVGAHLVPDCGAWLGAWSSDHGVTGFTAQIEEHESRIGRKLDIVHNYHPAGHLPLDPDEKAFIAKGQILLVNWKPTDHWADAAGVSHGGLASIDSDIDTVAASMKSVAPHEVMLVIFHEPENDLIKNGGQAGTASDYVGMWKNVRSRFDAAAVSNVIWVWDVELYSKFWDDEISLYPGDDLVDWVMFDPYDFSGTKGYVNTVMPDYQWLSDHSGPGHRFDSKPWGLAEWGVDDPSAPGGMVEQQFYPDAAASFGMFPRLKAYVIFDAGETKVDSSPAEEASYNAFAATSYLNQPRVLP